MTILAKQIDNFTDMLWLNSEENTLPKMGSTYTISAALKVFGKFLPSQ